MYWIYMHWLCQYHIYLIIEVPYTDFEADYLKIRLAKMWISETWTYHCEASMSFVACTHRRIHDCWVHLVFGGCQILQTKPSCFRFLSTSRNICLANCAQFALDTSTAFTLTYFWWNSIASILYLYLNLCQLFVKIFNSFNYLSSST